MFAIIEVKRSCGIVAIHEDAAIVEDLKEILAYLHRSSGNVGERYTAWGVNTGGSDVHGQSTSSIEIPTPHEYNITSSMVAEEMIIKSAEMWVWRRKMIIDESRVMDL